MADPIKEAQATSPAPQQTGDGGESQQQAADSMGKPEMATTTAPPQAASATPQELKDTPEPSTKPKNASGGPDTGDPTDGRPKHQWRSAYVNENGDSPWCQIYAEAIYTVLIAFVALTLLFCVWRGYLPHLMSLTSTESAIFKVYGYYFSAGLLGGTVFCLKYLYRVVARGYWHEDRRLWRYISPWISAFVAFCIGALIQSKMISFTIQNQGPSIVGTGFLIGYFGDQAVAKLHEIANVLFGTSTRSS